MKTNHRRQNKGKFLVGFNYSYLTVVSLIRNGCSPTYGTRVGAAAAISGKKKKDHRAERHRLNHEVRQSTKDLDHD